MSFSGRPQSFMEQTIVTDVFFPELSLGEFQNLHRVPSNIADAAVAHQVTVAVEHVNTLLNEQQANWHAAGFISLVAVDNANQRALVSLYKTAVYYLAKANLLADFQTFSRRDIAENQATEADTTRQTLLAQHRKAVRRLQGKLGNIDAELL
mgnify:CR=1 FL=1